ncbi:MAG TPA: Jag N-terminal domain-containing protein [Candidatus Polarisedimenticolaceae bacterium]|nr:Jag N-terminal domain-containing protein [Candidatus Polarisedimenticolaceae bacterium]
MVKQREFEGKDLETALEAAAAALGVEEPELDYEIVEQGRRGLFGVGAKSVRIRVMPPLADAPDPLAAAELHLPPEIREAAARRERGRRESQRRESGQPRGGPRRDGQGRDRKKRTGQPAGETQPSERRDGHSGRGRSSKRRRRRRDTPRESTALPRPVPVVDGPPAPGSDEVVATLDRMIGMMGMELTAKALGSTNGVIVELSGDDRDLLFDKDGELLSALQFLLNRMARRTWPEAGRIQLTSDGGRPAQERDEELVELTHEVAQQVESTGKPQRLRPMNAYERRLVHLTIREHTGLGSRSEGNGHLKRVKIYKQDEA